MYPELKCYSWLYCENRWRHAQNRAQIKVHGVCALHGVGARCCLTGQRSFIEGSCSLRVCESYGAVANSCSVLSCFFGVLLWTYFPHTWHPFPWKLSDSAHDVAFDVIPLNISRSPPTITMEDNMCSLKWVCHSTILLKASTSQLWRNMVWFPGNVASLHLPTRNLSWTIMVYIPSGNVTCSSSWSLAVTLLNQPCGDETS